MPQGSASGLQQIERMQGFAWGDGANDKHVWIDGDTAYTDAGLAIVGRLGLVPMRFVGATASAAPASGTWQQNDIVYSANGSIWICTVAGTPGTWTQVGASAALLQDASVNISVDGNGVAPTTGTKASFVLDFPATIRSVTLLGDRSGDCVFDILKSTYSGFPTTASICAAAFPTLSAAQKYQDTTLTGWTTAITAGDVYEVSLTSIATIQRVTLSLKVSRTS